ncbi:MAG: hypothetical protein V7606_356 [Burkholderiales bacterium]|jgi:hypothetical protein
MTTEKVYAVFLVDGADDELGKSFGVFLKSKDGDAYFSARAVDSEGNYFRMTVDQEILPGEKVEIELQIHHEFIKGVFSGSDKDLKELGIT